MTNGVRITVWDGRLPASRMYHQDCHTPNGSVAPWYASGRYLSHHPGSIGHGKGPPPVLGEHSWHSSYVLSTSSWWRYCYDHRNLTQRRSVHGCWTPRSSSSTLQCSAARISRSFQNVPHVGGDARRRRVPQLLRRVYILAYRRGRWGLLTRSAA